MTQLTARELLIMLYEAALDAVDGRFLVSQWLRDNQAAPHTGQLPFAVLHHHSAHSLTV